MTHPPPPKKIKVPVLVALGGLNLYPVVEQLPWTAPGLPEGSYVILLFSGASGQVRAAARAGRGAVAVVFLHQHQLTLGVASCLIEDGGGPL
jgi:hypothetical protein